MATNRVKNKKIEKKSGIVEKRVRLAPGIAAAAALYSVSADAIDIPVPVSVPEPGIFSLLAAGVAGVACAKLIARRRKK